jgi:O-antigen/teichoic acid export membrane protein
MKTIETSAPASRVRGLVMSLGSQVLSQATNLVRGLIVPNLLGPASYGLIATVNALDRYTPYVNGGSHYYVLNRLPVVDEESRRERALQTIFTFTLLTSAASALLLLASAYMQSGSRGVTVAYGVATLALSPLASGLWRLHASVLRVDERIPLLTRLTNAQSLVSSALIVGLTYAWGLVGTFTAQLLASVFVLALVAVASPYRFRPGWDWRLLREVLAFTIPVFFVSGLLLTVIDTMEVFVLAHLLGSSAVGMYSWGMSIAAILFMWTNGLTTVYSTPVVKAVHADTVTGGRDGVRVFARLLVANCLVFASLSVMAYVFLPVVATVLFPGFTAGVAAARLLVVSAYYENISVLGLFVLTAQKRFNVYLVWLAVLVIALVPLLYWLAPRGIIWVAMLAIARRVAKAQTVLSIGVRGGFARGVHFWAFCAGLYVLGLAPIGAGWLLDLADLAVTRQNFYAHVPQLGITFAMVVLLLALPLYALQRRFKMLEPLWSS